jgi:hypothetical protein
VPLPKFDSASGNLPPGVQEAGGELFPAASVAGPGGTAFLDFFQRDKTTGDPKGIIAIDLGGV